MIQDIINGLLLLQEIDPNALIYAEHDIIMTGVIEEDLGARDR